MIDEKGLTERKVIPVELPKDLKRHGPNQVPVKGVDKASKGGKKFKIK